MEISLLTKFSWGSDFDGEHPILINLVTPHAICFVTTSNYQRFFTGIFASQRNLEGSGHCPLSRVSNGRL